MLVNRDAVTDMLGPRAVDNRHYVGVDEGVDPEAVAERLTGELIPNGVDARTFLDELEGELAEQQGFFRLMQGYLGLGLAIGIAGLGVVMVRAVRERRRQVGMLRAMGFSAAVVRRAFLLEAVFIAAQGVALGIGLGMLTSYQVLTNSETLRRSAAAVHRAVAGAGGAVRRAAGGRDGGDGRARRAGSRDPPRRGAADRRLTRRGACLSAPPGGW